MQKIPTLVQDLGVARLTNAVYVALMKFTVEQVEHFVDQYPSGGPETEVLGPQLYDAKKAYKVVNDAYALTLRSAITDDIAALDKEGDQLIYAVKGTVEAALRMTFDAEKVKLAQLYSEFLKKYKVDPTENMISEWSKVQQLCEEADASTALTAAEAALGITEAMNRLKVIADAIRQKITQRSGELPEAQQMKKARAAMDPEYKALILVLNSLAVAYASKTSQYDPLIKTLNDNINYVRIHAMSKSASGGDEPAPEPEPETTEAKAEDTNAE